MPEATFEVEIRCDIPARRISDDQFDKLTRDIVSLLEKSGKVEYRQITHPVAFTVMRLFLARVHAEVWNASDMHKLAEYLGQRYITVYSPSRNEGAFYGPQAEMQGDFDLRCFSRFDPDAVRRELMAKPADPVMVNLIYKFALKVISPEELASLDKQPRMHFLGMVERRVKKPGPPPTVAEVEGFLELATEHCWYPAFRLTAQHQTP